MSDLSTKKFFFSQPTWLTGGHTRSFGILLVGLWPLLPEELGAQLLTYAPKPPFPHIQIWEHGLNRFFCQIKENALMKVPGSN